MKVARPGQARSMTAPDMDHAAPILADRREARARGVDGVSAAFVGGGLLAAGLLGPDGIQAAAGAALPPFGIAELFARRSRFARAFRFVLVSYTAALLVLWLRGSLS